MKKRIGLADELGLEIKKEICTKENVDSNFLKDVINHESDSPYAHLGVKKTALAIITRVPTSKIEAYIERTEEMESWRKERVADMINLLLQTPEARRAEFIKYVTKTILSKRKKNSNVQKLKNTEGLIVNLIIQQAKSNADLELINKFTFPKEISAFRPDLVIKNNRKAIIEIIEFDFSSDIDVMRKKLHQLGYYLLISKSSRISEFAGFQVEGLFICSKTSKQFIAEAKAINVKIKEINLKEKNFNF